MSNENQNPQASFAGEWLGFDNSEGIDDWTNWKINVRGSNIFVEETSHRRKPSKGTMNEDKTATVDFTDDRQQKIVLIDDNTIEFDDDPANRWYRKDSPEDPHIKFGTNLKNAEVTNVGSIVELALQGDRDLRYNRPGLISGTKLKLVVDEWIKWINSSDPSKASFVEITADKLRNSPDIVRHLVVQLTQTTGDGNAVQQPGITEQKDKTIQEATLKGHRRIAMLLAEMSDDKYFSKTEASYGNYDNVKESLLRYAVPILVSRLPTETDLEIRKNFAVVLGELRTPECIDALVRTVVSDEQIRASRKEMLSDYYLKPSKKQSEQASTILEGAVDEAKRTLRLLQGLNVIVFIVGMFVLVGGLFISITSEDAARRVVGALSGLGGLIGVIGLLIRDPLNRIQNALSNLVQLESAFTSFIWELNLNSTYIQSQYVAEGILREEDVARTLSRIEGAMDLALRQVAAYAEEGKEENVPYLTHLSPMVGKVGDTINVYGNHIKVTDRTKETTGQIAVAINHIPYKPIDRPEKNNMVSFVLPKEMPAIFGAMSGKVWLSLVINGVETNALPFNILEANDKAN